MSPKATKPKVKAPAVKAVAKAAKAPKAPKAKKLTKAQMCTHPKCKTALFAQGYCRVHYITNWKHIKFDRQVKAERRLNAYIDRLSKKYPKDYLEKIKEGLEDEGKFKQVANELNVDVEEPSETDTEFLEKFMRTVKVSE